jgi:hypothetical protein
MEITMNTKIASFILLTLVLTAVTYKVSGQYSVVRRAPAGRVPTINPTLTQTTTATTEPSPTHTATSVPPTLTATPLPPTSTPTSPDRVAKVTGQNGVNVRFGPCNQPVLFTAPYGAELPVTGWYRTSNDYIWWRIQFTRSGRVYEGWVYGGFVEVSNATDLPFVPSRCPSFDETPPTPTEAQVSIPTTPPVVLPACQTRTDVIYDRIEGTPDYVEPRLVQGDGEFDGNGPNVTIKVSLAHNGYEIAQRIFMRAEETAPDWTIAEKDTGWRRAFRAPPGWRILTMDVNLSLVNPAKGIYYGEWSWSYTDDDIDVDIYEPNDGGLVSRYAVKGDTKGEDVWSGGYQHPEDTYAAVSFRWVRIELIQEGNCQ